MEKSTYHCSRLSWIVNSGSIGVTRTSMCSYNRSVAASRAKCMIWLLTIYFPREFGMFFSSCESDLSTHTTNIWERSGQNNPFYFISKLERSLRLVNLAGLTLLLGPLKFKVLFVAKLLRDLSPDFLNFNSNKSLKLSFTLNCVLKRANDLKTISNWFVLLSTCFWNFEAVPHEWKSFPNPSDSKY